MQRVLHAIAHDSHSIRSMIHSMFYSCLSWQGTARMTRQASWTTRAHYKRNESSSRQQDLEWRHSKYHGPYQAAEIIGATILRHAASHRDHEAARGRWSIPSPPQRAAAPQQQLRARPQRSLVGRTFERNSAPQKRWGEAPHSARREDPNKKNKIFCRSIPERCNRAQRPGTASGRSSPARRPARLHAACCATAALGRQCSWQLPLLHPGATTRPAESAGPPPGCIRRCCIAGAAAGAASGPVDRPASGQHAVQRQRGTLGHAGPGAASRR